MFIKLILTTNTESKVPFDHRSHPGGVLLGILGEGVPPGSPNPDPISDQKM